METMESNNGKTEMNKEIDKSEEMSAMVAFSDFTSFINMLSEPVLMLDMKEHEALVNNAFSQEFKVSEGELKGEVLNNLLLRLGIDLMKNNQGQPFTISLPSEEKEAAKYSEKTVSYIPFHDEDGMVSAAMVVITSLCTAKECKDLWRRIMKSRQVCHDLNQPVQVILGYSEMILRNLEEDDKIYHNVSVIKKQIDKISTCTRELRATLRNEAVSGMLIPDCGSQDILKEDER